MKGIEAHKKSYIKQKEIFDSARERRISNRKKQIDELNLKIQNLSAQVESLQLQNLEEKEFESFESFRRKAEEKHINQKSKEKRS